MYRVLGASHRWKYFTCDEDLTSLKIVGCGIVYNVWCVTLLIHRVLYASRRSLFVGLCARAHRCPMGVSTQVGLWGDNVMNCHGLTLTTCLYNGNWLSQLISNERFSPQ